MIPSSCDISRSEQFYERLLRFYPERFRVEFGQQMMQAFQDQWRQEADRAALITKVSFWTQVLSDFVATVPLEHFKKGAFMDSAERDLRWDVRFGVQMFLRHFAMALKYALYSGLAVLTVWTIAILVVWLCRPTHGAPSKQCLEGGDWTVSAGILRVHAGDTPKVRAQ